MGGVDGVKASRANGRATASVLWRTGGRRYAAALAVDSLGDGMLRPFLLLYAVAVLRMPLAEAGLALSLGLVAGLLVLPVAGRWLDAREPRWPAGAALLSRAAGLVVLVGFPAGWGFGAACLLLGAGSQVFPPAHAAMIASLAGGRDRDAALAASRVLRNAGMGVGALAATAAVSNGIGVMHALIVVTAALYVASAVTVLSMRTVRRPSGRSTVTSSHLLPSAPAMRAPAAQVGNRSLGALYAANLPFALCFDVLEVALPALLVTRLHAPVAFSSALFVGNTALVIVAQVSVVRWLARYPRRVALALSGAVLSFSYLLFLAASSVAGTGGAVLICVVAVAYTAGEIAYTGTGTALIVAAAPPDRLGQHLARWQLSTGFGKAVAPLTLTALLTVGPAALWVPLAVATAAGALVIAWRGPHDTDPLARTTRGRAVRRARAARDSRLRRRAAASMLLRR